MGNNSKRIQDLSYGSIDMWIDDCKQKLTPILEPCIIHAKEKYIKGYDNKYHRHIEYYEHKHFKDEFGNIVTVVTKIGEE